MNFPFALSDSQWLCIQGLLPRKQHGQYDMRRIVAALLYITKTGCQWRALPASFPPWASVYYHFRSLNARGVFNRLMDQLRQQVRHKEGRAIEPTAAIIDSQSVRTAAGVSKARGWDGGKRLNGRKRHLVTDTLGLPLALRVGSAAASDRGGWAMLTASVERHKHLKVLYADRGYWGVSISDIPLEIVLRNDAASRWRRRPEDASPRHFEPVKKRWVVERSFGWLGLYRRLAKDYEKRPDCSAAMILLAFITIMLKRLT